MEKHWAAKYSHDITQSKKKLKDPQVRVWVHPKTGGDDYSKIFNTFDDAKQFIKTTPDAEKEILMAFGGYEIAPKLSKQYVDRG